MLALHARVGNEGSAPVHDVRIPAALSALYRVHRGAASTGEAVKPGALQAGYRTDLWTLPRVTELIHQKFGVRYHPAHVWKVLTALGWSCHSLGGSRTSGPR
jgi:hypothetical protein